VGTYGTFSVNAAGQWSYATNTAHNEFAAGSTYTDTFNVVAVDGTVTSVTVNIAGTNDAAVLSSASVNLTETNSILTTNGVLTISDVDSAATFIAQNATTGSYGNFSINSSGQWSYASNTAHNEFKAGSTYTDTFNVAAADGTTTAVTITILGTNDAPIAFSDTFFTQQNAPVNFTAAQLLSNDTDVDSTSLMITSVTSGAGGTAVLNPNGTVTFTPNADFKGTADFTYTVGDGVSTSNSAAVTVNVVGIAAISNPVAIEGNNLLYSVDLSTASPSTTTFNFNLGGGTASGGDYGSPAFSNGVTLAGGVLTIPAGVTNFTITLPTVNDVINETNETVPLTIGGVTATGTITDNDTAPSITIDDVTINEGAGTATFTVTLSAASGQSVSVNYASSNGTATASNDYTAVNGTLTFAPGTTTQTITVPIINDTIFEGSEAFNINLTNPVNATISDSQGVGTLIDNDSAPTINSIVGQIGVEGSSLVYNVILTNSSTTPTSFAYSLGGGTASATDYGAPTFSNGVTLSGGVLTVPAGVTSFSVTVTTVDDSLTEANETIPLTIGGVTGTSTIIDNDFPSLSINDVSVNEAAGTITFTVSLSAVANQTVTVGYNTSNGTATAGLDYSSITNGTLTFAAGVTTQTITVQINNDSILENNETFNVNLVNATNATIADGLGIGTIIDNDVAPLINSISSPGPSEGSDLVYNVVLNGVSAVPVTYNFSFGGGSATTADYGAPTFTNGVTLSGGVITVPAGVTNFNVNIPTVDDALRENLETVPLTIGTVSAVGSINDNDPTPSLVVNNVSVNEGAGTATFTVTLSAASGQTVTVNYNTGNNTAIAGNDYTNVNGTLTFAPGVTTQTITVPITDDTLFEGSETFNVNLSGATNASIATSLGVGTIVDNDTAPGITINDVTVNEAAGIATFTVSLSAVSGLPVTVGYNTSNGTATAGTDYSSITNGTLTFAAGVTTQTITVQINNDNTLENNETFNVHLVNPTNATIVDGLGVGTIIDNDVAPLINSISSPGVTEGGNMVYTVVLNNAAAIPVTYPFSLGGGTATAADFGTPVFSNGVTLVNGLLTVPAGVTNFNVTVPTVDDAIRENSETIPLTIGTVSATGTIQDNDPTPSLAINNVTVNEDAGTVTFTVTLSSASGQNISVNYNTANNSAIAGSDYTSTNGTLTFAPGVISQSITIPITNDALFENNETFNVNLSNATNASIATSLGVATIIDNDFSDNNEVVSVAEDSILSGNVLLGTPTSGGAVSVSNFSIAGMAGTFSAGQTAVINGVGTMLINANGNYVFTPAANYNGTVPVTTYTVTNGTNTDSSTLSITVTPVNDAAVIAGTTSANLTETNSLLTTGGTLTITDIDSPATFVAQSGTAGLYGSFSINAAGVWSYSTNTAHNEFAPGTNYTDNFTVVSADGTPKVVTVTIAGTNDGPVALNDTFSVNIASLGSNHLTGLHADFYNYREGVDGSNLISIPQVLNFINSHTANASFVSSALNYGSKSGDLGVATSTTDNLKNWLGSDSSSLVRTGNLISSGDAIIDMNGFVKMNAGNYTFRVTADDGYSIRIDGHVVAEVNRIQSSTTNLFSFALAASGLHQIEIIYWDQGGDYNLKVEYKKDNAEYSVLGTADASGNGILIQSDVIVINAQDLISNDTDVDNTFSIASVSAASHGSVSLNGNGQVLLKVEPGYEGTVTFNYTIKDSAGATSTATATINVDLNAPDPIIVMPNNVQDIIYEDLGVSAAGMTAANIESALGLASGALSLFNPSPGNTKYSDSGNVTAIDGNYISNTYYSNAGTPISLNWTFKNAEINSSQVSSGRNDLLLLVIKDSHGTIIQGPQLITSSEQLAGASTGSGVFSYTPTSAGAYEFDWIVINGANSSNDSSVTVSSPNNNPVVAIDLLINSSIMFPNNADSLGITISGVPLAAFLTAGINMGNGVWALTQDQLHNLQMVHDTAGTYNLTVTATASDTSGNSNVVSENLTVQISSISSNSGDMYEGSASSDLMMPLLDTTGHYYSGYDGADTQSAGSGNDLMYGGAGDDSMTGGGGNDVLHGGDGNDNIIGGEGNDVLFGESGIDNLMGEAGNDILSGGLGNDTLNGGTGNDYLIGGKGSDLMTGGGGIDTFLWINGDSSGGAADTITDFKANPVGISSDASILNLADLLSDEKLGDSPLGSDSLDSYLNVSASGGNTTIKIDANGEGSFGNPSQTIILQGVDLTATFATTNSHDIVNQLITNGNLIVE
ncbi:MAG TPA: Calx-beta domain-containing protein, partial [Legionella sp.]|nr:Calx-beta domain-containing protein [Legionella sp.]